MFKRACLLAAVTTLACMAAPASAALVLSANGQPWDIDDSTGHVGDGGYDAFDGYGLLKLKVFDGSANLLQGNTLVSGLNLSLSGNVHTTTTPMAIAGVGVSRNLNALAGTNILRYIETFTNTSGSLRNIQVGWGGNLGSDSATTLAATSSGDLVLNGTDTSAVTIEQNSLVPTGPSSDPVVGVKFRNAGDTSFRAFGDDNGDVFTNAWSGNGNDGLSYVHELTLNAGQTLTLAYFLYRGLEENVAGPLGQVPASGTEIALAVATLNGLTEQSMFGDLSAQERGLIANFAPVNPGPGNPVPAPATLALTALALAALRATRRR